MSRRPTLVPEEDLKGCESPEQLVRALFRPLRTRTTGKTVTTDKPLVRKTTTNHVTED